MATVIFLLYNVSLPLPRIFEYLLNGFDHNTQEKFEFSYNVFYGSRVMPLKYLKNDNFSGF
jgi:hypothetical protein